MIRLVLILFSLLLTACSAPKQDIPAQKAWAIAIHGGAGTISKDLPDSVRQPYLHGLEAALTIGVEKLKAGEPALDVVIAVITNLEDNPLFNAAKGAVFTAGGNHELDASIMDGSTLAAGAVAGVTTVKNPIKLARHIMENTPHILLSGPGADAYAAEHNFDLVENTYFDTDRRLNQLKRAQGLNKDKGTVGCVVLDVNGNLAAGTSTGGMTNKMQGRIGDSPIIGAGNYANNKTCAVSGTGTGEQFIRHVVGHDISALMDYKNMSLAEATNQVVNQTLNKGDGGVIAVDHAGNISMVFNSTGMFRGAADATGLFEVKIWD